DAESGVDISEHCNGAGLKVQLNKVTFGYPDAETNIINDLDFVIDPNQHVLISGQNNSGKSTLLHLIAGIYAPKAGYISYNEFPHGNLDPQKLRSVIGDCLMEEQLFEATVFENISMGRANATFANVQ